MKSGSPEPKQNLTPDSPNGGGDTPSSRGGPALEAELETLKQRLAGAESSLRTMRWVGSAAAALFTAGTIGAVTLAATHSGVSQSDRATIRAPFRVVDAQGKPLLHLDADQNGPQLRLFDRAGEPITSLGATPEGGIFRVSSRGGKGNLQLYADSHGGQITLSGQNQSHPVAWLGSKEEGGGLGIYDAAGSPVAWVTTGKDRRGLSVGDQAGHPVAWLGAAREGGVAVYNRSGKMAAYLTISRGSGSLAVYDPTRKKSSTLTADTDLSGDRVMSGPSIAAAAPANPAAGAKLSHVTMRPQASADPGWLLHRSSTQAVPPAQHPAEHPASMAPPLTGAAHSTQVATTAAASHTPKPAAPLTAIGPENEAGPQGMIGGKPGPAGGVAARAPEEAELTGGGSSAGRARSEQKRALEGTHLDSSIPAASVHHQQKLARAAQPTTTVAPLPAGGDIAGKAPQVHPSGRAATTHRSMRHHRHGRRHHSRRAHHRHSRRQRRSLRGRHHRRHHARHSSHRLARRSSHPGNRAHRLAERTGTPIHPQRLAAGAAGPASPAIATKPQHSPTVALPVDPD
jgi:hypothetical protein